MPVRPLIPLVAALVLAAPASSPTGGPTSTPPSARDRLYASLDGRWSGTLEYKDYQDSSRRVTLPTTLDVTRSADSSYLTLRFTYDDGPGKTVVQTDRLALDASATTLAWGAEKDTARQRFAVRAMTGPPPSQPLRLVLESEGSDDDRPATIRKTIAVAPRLLRILKETRPAGSGEFGFRHRYELTRVE